MVEQYHGDKSFSDVNSKPLAVKNHNNYNAKKSSGGHGHGTGVEVQKRPHIIAMNGNDLIISDEAPGMNQNRYIRFSNVSISEVMTERGQDAFTTATIKLNVYGGFDTKIVDIPDHIPGDQWARYVQGVFDAKK